MKLTNNPKPEFMKVTIDAPKVDDMSQFTTCMAALMEVMVGKKILHESLQVVNFYPIQAMQQIIPASREISRRKRIPILVCNLTQPDEQVEEISVTHFGAIVSGSITRLFCVSYKNKFYNTKFGLHVICVSGCGAEIKTDSLYKELLAKQAPFHFVEGAICLGHNEKLAKERFLLWKKELVAFFEEKNYGQALIIADKMLKYTEQYHPDDSERMNKCYKNLALCLKHLDNSRATEESTQKPEEKSISSEEITWGSISEEKKYLLDKISAITVYRDSIVRDMPEDRPDTLLEKHLESISKIISEIESLLERIPVIIAYRDNMIKNMQDCREKCIERSVLKMMSELKIMIEKQEKVDREIYQLLKKKLPDLFKQKNYQLAFFIAKNMLVDTLVYHPDKLERLKICFKNVAICLEHLQNFTAARNAWAQVEQIDQKLTNMVDSRNEAQKKIRKLGNKEKKKSRKQNPQARISGLRDNLFSSESSASRSSSSASSSSSGVIFSVVR